MRSYRSHIGRTVVAGAVLLLVWALASEPLVACPACNEAVSQQPTEGLGEGLSYSVIGMMSMPFLLFATVAGIVIRAYMKHSRNSDPGMN
jgi:hypothetical protein